MADLSSRMREVLTELDEVLRTQIGRFERLAPEAEANGSLLRPPASEDEIAAAERRLGVTLPPSYRAFLSISNGAWFWSHEPALLYGEGDIGPSLLSVGDLERASIAQPITLQVWVDEMDGQWADASEEVRPRSGEPADICYFEPYRDALVISTHERDHAALVPRHDVEEWEVWDVGHSEWQSHVSFLDYLQHLLTWGRRRAEHTVDLDEIAQRAAGGHVGLLRFLADAYDERAGEIARDLVQRRVRGYEHALQLLGLLGEPASIPVLEALLKSGDLDEPPDWRRGGAEQALLELRSRPADGGV